MHPPPISSGRNACLKHRARGFTAIELMVTIGIAAILAALAAPSFTGLMERWRVRQAIEGFESTLYYARGEAIKRGGNIIIRKLPNNTNGCTSGSGANSWGCGWQVCEDTNADDACQATEVLQRFDAPAKLDILRIDNSGGTFIRLDRWGMAVDTGGALTPIPVEFSFLPQGRSTPDPAAKSVCMSSGGRMRTISNPPC